jgi:hypothetical protein
VKVLLPDDTPELSSWIGDLPSKIDQAHELEDEEVADDKFSLTVVLFGNF